MRNGSNWLLPPSSPIDTPQTEGIAGNLPIHVCETLVNQFQYLGMLFWPCWGEMEGEEAKPSIHKTSAFALHSN